MRWLRCASGVGLAVVLVACGGSKSHGGGSPGTGGSAASGGGGSSGTGGTGGGTGGSGGTGAAGASGGTAGSSGSAGSAGSDAGPGGAAGADAGCGNLATDVHNCGACGHDCTTLPGVDASAVGCTSGVCDVTGACLAGRAHCSSNPDDGCEADLTSPATCGSCATSCTDPTPLCEAAGDAGSYACAPSCSAPTATACGSVCVDLDTDASHCGTCSNACPTSANGTATCSGGQCSLTCDAGYHDCSGTCESDSSAASCGTSCTPCPVPAHSSATCDGTSCGFACVSGYHDCSGACVWSSDPATCGAACTPCTPPANATATCDGTSCGFSCNSGYHDCTGSCVDNTAVATCGAACTPCPVPANGTATCDGSACGISCNAGYVPDGNSCSIAPPQLLSPLSTATVTSRKPTLRWKLATGSTGAHIEICADRACSSVLQTIDTTASSAAPATALPTGVVYWRAMGVKSAVTGTASSPVWQMVVGVRSAAFDTSFGTLPDFNGDGYGDLVVGETSTANGEGQTRVYLGGPGGLPATASSVIASPAGPDEFFGAAASAGDVNGDGYGDVIIGVPDYGTGGEGRAYVYLGGPTPFSGGPVWSADGALAGDNFGERMASAGDVNGDGYADIVIGAPHLQGSNGSAYVYLGGPSGPAATPVQSYANQPGSVGSGVAGIGDVNGDGYADLAIGAPDLTPGQVYVYYGSASGPPATPSVTLTAPSATVSAFGQAVGRLGDVNGDGYPDLGVGAYNWVYIYYGGPSGPATTADVTLQGSNDFGYALAGVGDTNADGYTDVLIGAGGTASLFLGSASGLPATASVSLTASGSSSVFGWNVANLGDTDGDGYAELAVGDWLTSQVSVYAGSATGPASAPTRNYTGSNGGSSSEVGNGIAGE